MSDPKLNGASAAGVDPIDGFSFDKLSHDEKVIWEEQASGELRYCAWCGQVFRAGHRRRVRYEQQRYGNALYCSPEHWDLAAGYSQRRRR
jgi:hypothetical protein